MAYSAYAVANAFIQRAQGGHLRDLTPMKLQKLLYFTQAWHLKGTRGIPLLDDHFARWQFGPVIPAIYHAFKAYGYMPITQMATTLASDSNGFAKLVPTIPNEDRSSWDLIDAIINRYGALDAQTLSNMTHAQESAWSLEQPDGSVISARQMMDDTTLSIESLYGRV